MFELGKHFNKLTIFKFLVNLTIKMSLTKKIAMRKEP